MGKSDGWLKTFIEFTHIYMSFYTPKRLFKQLRNKTKIKKKQLNANEIIRTHIGVAAFAGRKNIQSTQVIVKAKV